MIIQRKFKKTFVCIFILVLIIGILPFGFSNLVNEDNSQNYLDFGTEIYFNLRPYLDANIEDSSFQFYGATITNYENTLEINFVSEDAYPEDLNFLQNIKPSSISKNNSYILINLSIKKIQEADFSVYENQNFIFGNNYFSLPENSRVIFKNNLIKIKVENGANFSKSPGFLDLDALSYSFEIEGKEIQVSDDLKIIDGKVKVIPEGYLVEQGNVISKGKSIFVESKKDQVLISNFNLKGYSGNWIYEFSDNLEIHSSNFGSVKIQFLEENGLVNVEKEDLLLIQVENGDSLKIIKQDDLNAIPKFEHISSEKGKTKITNGNIGTFVYSKEDLILERNSLNFGDRNSKNNEVEMIIQSDSENLDFDLNINSNGEAFIQKGNVIQKINEELSENLKNLEKERNEGFVVQFEEEFNYTYYEKMSGYLTEDEYSEISNKFANELSKFSDEDFNSENYPNIESLNNFLDYCMKNKIPKDKSLDFISSYIESSDENTVPVFNALPSSIESLKRTGLSSKQSMQLISTTLEKSSSEEGLAILESNNLLSPINSLNKFFTPEQSYEITNSWIEKCDKDCNINSVFDDISSNKGYLDLSSRLSGLKEIYGLNNQECFELTKGAIERTEPGGDVLVNFGSSMEMLNSFKFMGDSKQEALENIEIIHRITGESFNFANDFLISFKFGGYTSDEAIYAINLIDNYIGKDSEYMKYAKENPDSIKGFISKKKIKSYESPSEKKGEEWDNSDIDYFINSIERESYIQLQFFIDDFTEEKGKEKTMNFLKEASNVLESYTPEELFDLNGFEKILLVREIAKKSGLNSFETIKLVSFFQ
ncbi:MAG: hypothetical protein WC812_04625 [Candidatus Pacearchaeota archaeon]|jgi:hypothetical protein